MPKDLFSRQADVYAQYRPTYPDELFEYIVSFVAEKETAWDCATGNGQAAVKLASYFKKVIATDFSEAQLSKAIPKDNITYQLSTAESTPFRDNTFDLITIATAYHWLNWTLFHQEATRVGKEGAVIAAWTYYAVQFNEPALDTLYNHFYKEIIQPYWDYERRYLDERYETVAFDFERLPSRPFASVLQWSREKFKGFLDSWSAVQRYKDVHHTSPLSRIEQDLDHLWPEHETRTVTLPIALLLGRIHK